MANHKSKRISQGKQLKASRKVRESFRKKQKQSRKNSVRKIDVPKALLLTEAEKEQIQFIKEQTEQRTAEHVRTVGQTECASKSVTSLKNALAEADIAVEVLDYRDIPHSRSIQCEEIVKSSGKDLYLYLGHYSGHFNVDIQGLEKVGSIIADLSVLSKFKNICIFGNAKSGKFTLTKLIEEKGIQLKSTRITVPVETPSPSSVLRGVDNSERVDPLACFSKIFPFMNPLYLADYYKICPVSEMNELLLMLGKAYSMENRERKTVCAGALHVLRDIQAGKIDWACVDGQYAFRFIK